MDRRALKREYKETPRTMGIYRVQNKTNGKALVGSSVNAPAMLNRHRAELRMGVHKNRALQEDWNELSAEGFAFEVVDVLKPPDDLGYDPTADLKALEELWLDRLSPFGDRGYNSNPK